MHWKDKLAQADVLFGQAKAILTDAVPAEGGKTRPATAEDKQQVEQLMEDAKVLKAEALQLKKLEELQEKAIAHLQTLQPPAGNPQPANGKGGGQVQGSEFKEWNEFLQAVWMAQSSRIQKADERLKFFYDDAPKTHGQKDMSGEVGESGGFLIPLEQETQLYALTPEQSQIESRVTRVRMRRRQIDVPVLDQTGTVAGRPHWFGGMIFYWEGESDEKTVTEAKFRKISLVAKKLIGYTRASDELVDDAAISLGDFLSGPMGFAGGVTWLKEYAFLRGTGVGQPLGVINAGATIVEGRHTAGTVVFDDLADMVAKFLPSGKGLWVISQSLMSDLIQLGGPTGNPSYIWQANARDGIPGMILGHPVLWSEKAPAAGNAGDIGLYDWKYYLEGDRQATTVESTKFDRWRYDETSWRMVMRCDGQPWLSAPITYEDGVTQISPFVILGATAGGS